MMMMTFGLNVSEIRYPLGTLATLVRTNTNKETDEESDTRYVQKYCSMTFHTANRCSRRTLQDKLTGVHRTRRTHTQDGRRSAVAP